MSINSKKESRKRRRPEDSESPGDDTPANASRDDLKAVLKERLREKRLGRLAPSARDNKINKLELKLKEVGENEDHRQKIQQNIDLLRRVNDIQIDTSTGEYPDYTDNCSYGGGIERGD
jgi:hypothetical protein